ncbi:outer membrane efflux protein [Kordia sp. SMS9]|uniref:TolC family protein n=1 Tax=Kordia sp. SMS9 TaxID=2282170 RepID=UPI000E0D04BB|nr:TolC family protein [Kordia sp. SMS9]AXG69472.1 outer membrane efflux protein [Kordia sp. SMS9]
MRYIFLFLVLLFSGKVAAQIDNPLDSIMSLDEYLGYVKTYHPIVKQANLIISESEAKLLKSRGAFDPKLEVDYDRKKFKNTEYYDKLNATFKIPTWYGVEFKANFEENTGEFLNPEFSVPTDGLYSAGVSVSLARGFLMNERMAMLKQAKLFTQQAQADQQLLVNEILYEASITYFKWLKTFRNRQVFESFLSNAQLRFDGIKRSYQAGEKAAIDTLEARLTLNTRKLDLEKARIKYIKTSLELSNFLWLNNDTPVELRPSIQPDTETVNRIDEVLNVTGFDNEDFDVEAHPKIQSLNLKYESLVLNRRLKQNNLLPQIDLQYNFLSQTPDEAGTFNTQNYKAGLNISFPLFLRKERGDLRLAKLKLQDVDFERTTTRVNLKNKIDAVTQEIESYQIQNQLTEELVEDYEVMLRAEERKFFLGESSLFLVNSREAKLIENLLKAIELENKYFKTKASLFNIMANTL